MNNQFDELTRNLAQSVTRRAALKKFGVGLAGMALACFGLTNKAEAQNCFNKCMHRCVHNLVKQGYTKDQAILTCQGPCAFECNK